MQVPTEKRERTGWLIALGVCLVGIADGIYLLMAHLTVKQGGQLSGLCDASDSVSCVGAIQSSWSSLLGIPVPTFTIAFYAAMAWLLVRATSRKGRLGNTPELDLVRVGAVFASVFGLILLAVMIQIGTICVFCLVMDAANLSLLGVTLFAIPRQTSAPAANSASKSGLSKKGPSLSGKKKASLAKQQKEEAKAVAVATPTSLSTRLQDIVNSDALIHSAVAFLGVLAVAHTLTIVAAGSSTVTVDSAYEIVVGYPQRHMPEGWQDAPVKGLEDAPIVIVEFSDFECPYCARLGDHLEELVAAYPETVQVRFMNFPLHNDCNPHVAGTGHEFACPAARASVCAQAEGKFWEMHDLIFENQGDLTAASFALFARELSLNPDEFPYCVEEQRSLDAVRAQADAGWGTLDALMSNPSGSTPYMVLNGLLVRGAVGVDALTALVERELREMAAGEGADPG